MLLKYIWHVFNRVIQDYRRFKLTQPWVEYTKKQVKISEVQTYKILNSNYKDYGIPRTITQIAADDRKFEQEHPEYFPGLQ